MQNFHPHKRFLHLNHKQSIHNLKQNLNNSLHKRRRNLLRLLPPHILR